MIPLIVDRLDDEDALVRFAAIHALYRMTGMRLGYQPGASDRQRAAAVLRWRRYLQEQADHASHEPPDAGAAGR